VLKWVIELYPWSVKMIIGAWSDCRALRTNQLPARKVIQNLETIMTLLLNANAARLLVYLPAIFSPPILCYCISFPMNLLADSHYWKLSGYHVECVCAVLTHHCVSTTKDSETKWGRPNNLLCKTYSAFIGSLFETLTTKMSVHFQPPIHQ